METYKSEKTYKSGWFRFWIKSDRGTNQSAYVFIKNPYLEKIEYDLESWCSQFGAWHASLNVVDYGWRRVSPSKLPKKYRDKPKRSKTA